MVYRSVLAVLAGLLLLTACSSDAEPAPQATIFDGSVPLETVLVSSPDSIALGEQRLIFLLERGPIRVGGPDAAATLELKGLGTDEVTIDAEWVWSDEERELGGAWVAWYEFPSTGTWRAALTVDGEVGESTTFPVQPNTPMPRTGDRAPRSATETLADAPLESLTTDLQPDERFYQLSVEQAIESGRPTALVFSTPAFCTTEVCGPLLDVIKTRIDEHGGTNFVHVEVYEDVNANGGELIARPSILEWGIQTEPWIFFIDADGVVTSAYEGVLSSTELDRELDALG
ncbi:MAG: thioredoxin family protein [Actinomycetota bacterium]